MHGLNTPHYTEDYINQYLLPVMLSLKPYNVLRDCSLLGTQCSSRVDNSQEILQCQWQDGTT